MRTELSMLLIGLWLLGCPRLPAEGHWVDFTDRSQNWLIAEYLRSSDLGEAVQTVRALGRRSDPCFPEVIESLLSSGRRAPEQEVLLLELLGSLNASRNDPGDADGRLAANREALERLAEALPGFGWSLRTMVIRLLQETGSPQYDRAVLAQAEELSRLLEDQAGRADAEQGELLLAVLDYAEERAAPLFLDPVLVLLEKTRDQKASRRAQAVAARLAGLLKRSYSNPEVW